MSHDLKVALMVEHPSREGHTARVLHDSLRRAGYSPRVFFNPYQLWQLILYRPHIVVTGSNKGLAGRLRAFSNARFLFLNYEQMICDLNERQIRPPTSPKDLAVFWSDEFAKSLIGRGWAENQLLRSSKIDYCGRVGRNERSAIKSKSNSKNIFVGLTDLHVFIPPHESYKANAANGASLDHYVKRSEWCIDNFNFILKAITYISEKEEGWSWTLKPHPLVPLSDYESAVFDGLSPKAANKMTISLESPHKLLDNCDFFITNYSSLAFDAALNDIPFCFLQQEQMPTFMAYSWIDEANTVMNPRDLWAAISKPPIVKARPDWLTRYFGEISISPREVADELVRNLRLVTQEEKTFWNFSRSGALSLFLSSFLRWVNWKVSKIDANDQRYLDTVHYGTFKSSLEMDT